MNNNLMKLEFNKILDAISNYCKTYIGKKYVSELRPSQVREEVQKMLNETSQGVILIQRNSTPPLGSIADITVYIKTLDGCGTLSIKALLELQNILQMSANLKDYFAKDHLATSDFSAIEQYFNDLYVNPSIVSTFAKSIIDEETIADSASSKLQDIRRRQRKIEQDIRSKLNTILHSSTYSKYMRENLVTIRNGRFVIPVKEEYRGAVKGFIHDMSSSGSTVFIEPISVFDLNNELSNLHIEESLEIERILQNLSGLLYPYTKELQNNVEIIGKLDFIFAKAHYSLQLHCTTPVLNDDKIINLKNARHPLISPEHVVPSTIELGKDFSTLIITGPNTGGKTVTLKTIGLLTVMACSGLNIPADEPSSIYVFDNVFADIGDEQSISESLSTFSSHMSNIVGITRSASTDSLILVDELGSGTDPLEGAHLAISILQHFTELGTITVATSHYQELKKYALVTPGFKNASVEFDIENLRPTYRLLVGIPGKSNAFAISRKLGLAETIIERASSMIDKETVNLEDLLKSIYDKKSQIEDEKARTAIVLQEAEELKKNLKHQNTDVLNKEKELIANAKQEAKQILLDAKETANSLIKDIGNSTSASQANKLRNKLNEEISSINKTNIEDVEIAHPISREDIKVGLDVFVANLKSEGKVISNISKDDTVQVQIGVMKLKVDIKQLQEITKSNKPSDDKITNYNYSGRSSLKSQHVSPEINLIGLTVDEAIPIIDKYLDDCYMAKLSSARIVHGKGTGALRNGIHRYLKTNKLVDTFRLGTFGEGEMGVTIVSLKF
ncbi:MAG: endonuclease MutS2 [Clostridia bacterium]|nr:endonuclease MutS2 [Clostridia bacterium]